MSRMRAQFVVTLLAVMSAASAAPAAAAVPAVTAASSFEAVRASHRSSDAILLDRQGRPLHRLRVDARQRRFDWVAHDELSAALITAVVNSEDRRFFEHDGVDWTGVASAGLRNALNGKANGASTLTMQLVGLLELRLARSADGRSWKQKIEQARLALQLEQHWSKEQILEAYLNLAPFRGEVVGIDAAAQIFFGKRPIGLSAWESALLAVMLRAPNATSNQMARRACRLLAQDDCTAYEGFTRLALARARGASPTAALSLAVGGTEGSGNGSGNGTGNGGIAASGTPQAAPHVARQLLRPGSTSVISTLDASLQRSAIDAIARHLGALQGRHVEDAAVLVLDNRTGEVLAWVGSSGALSSAPQVDGVTALRQAGSTLKPFVYALAIEDRLLTAASLIDDAPLDVATATGLYVPQNYDRGFKGLVTVRTALGSSLNTPAVRTLGMIGPDRLLERLRRAGFDSLRHDGEHYGLALALGGADVSLAELTNAFRMLANQGRYSPMRLQPADSAGLGPATRPVFSPVMRQVFSPAATFIVADLLSDRNARSLTFGLDSPMGTRFWSAVKTGTSKDLRDNWCVGFTDRFTVGVWVGNFSGQPMWNVSGSSGAAPIWLELVSLLHRQSPGRAPTAPDGVVGQPVSLMPIAADRHEWFIDGTQVSQVEPALASSRVLAIVTPQAGTRYALDPDIPPASQTVLFSAQGEGVTSVDWRLNGRRIGGGRRLAWSPMPGEHRLELWSAGRLIDSRQFEVRGAGIRRNASAELPTRPKPFSSRDG